MEMALTQHYLPCIDRMALELGLRDYADDRAPIGVEMLDELLNR